MSRVRTGNGTSDWADQGPAATGSGDAIASMGRLSALDVRGTLASGAGGGAGPIERRQVTEAERDARQPESSTPVQRAWNGHGPGQKEAPAMPDRHTAYGALADAAARADEALTRKRAADLAWAAAETEVRLAYAAVADVEPVAAAPVAVQPPPKPSVALPTASERMAKSRRNGQASMRKVVAKPTGTTGQKRTPEQRERMRQGQLAAIARRRAAAEPAP